MSNVKLFPEHERIPSSKPTLVTRKARSPRPSKLATSFVNIEVKFGVLAILIVKVIDEILGRSPLIARRLPALSWASGSCKWESRINARIMVLPPDEAHAEECHDHGLMVPRPDGAHGVSLVRGKEVRAHRDVAQIPNHHCEPHDGQRAGKENNY